MDRPSKEQVQSLVKELKATDNALSQTVSTISKHKGDVKKYYSELCKRGVEKSLSEVPIESLNTESDGINITALKNAGYVNLSNILGRSEEELKQVQGIGDVMASKIVQNANESRDKIVKNYSLRITAEDTEDPAIEGFISELYYLMKLGTTGDEISALYDVSHFQIIENSPKAEAINVVWIKWTF
ncbi:MAG: hypothetical protein J6U54_09025 [Clostridiales bacterium]|nr:hypothetical protein [Clostridiales bacterium]